jgi:hypothetical protein
VDGSLRDYEGRKHLFVYSIKKIENWNEMTHHFLGTQEALPPGSIIQ